MLAAILQIDLLCEYAYTETLLPEVGCQRAHVFGIQQETEHASPSLWV